MMSFKSAAACAGCLLRETVSAASRNTLARFRPISSNGVMVLSLRLLYHESNPIASAPCKLTNNTHQPIVPSIIATSTEEFDRGRPAVLAAIFARDRDPAGARLALVSLLPVGHRLEEAERRAARGRLGAGELADLPGSAGLVAHRPEKHDHPWRAPPAEPLVAVRRVGDLRRHRPVCRLAAIALLLVAAGNLRRAAGSRCRSRSRRQSSAGAFA